MKRSGAVRAPFAMRTVVAFAVSYLLLGCYRVDPLFCRDHADCTDSPGGTFCDRDGRYDASGHIARTCIPPPGGVCTSDADCHDPMLPACAEGLCRECNLRHHCDAAAPVCDPAGYLCVDCANDTDCPRFGSNAKCAPDGRCITCESNADCSGTTPACEATTGMCVPCEIEADCAERATTPHCSVQTGACVGCRDELDCAATGGYCHLASATCQSCSEDAQCSSGVCDEGRGACIFPANVLYVTAAAKGTTCTREAPCGTLRAAHAQVQGDRKYILVSAGLYDGGELVDKEFVLTGTNVTVVTPLVVRGTTRIEQLDFRGGLQNDRNATLVNVRVSGGTRSSAALILNGPTIITNSTIEGSPGSGVMSGTVGSLSMDRTVVRGNAGAGMVLLFEGTAEISNSQILNNRSGGLDLYSVRSNQGSRYRIVNTIIANNGGPLSTSAAVFIFDNPRFFQFEHNTITGNRGTGGATGIRCESITLPLVLRNNIIYGNVTDTTGAGQVSGACSHEYSLVGPGGVPPGTGNVAGEPHFVNPTTNDFHILVWSGAIGLADPITQRLGDAVAVTHDIDGQVRPHGVRADIGADEYVP